MASSSLKLHNSIFSIKGIGESKARILKKNNINSVEQLLYYFPRRYIDRSRISVIGELKPGELVTIIGIIRSISSRKIQRKNLRITEAIVFDGTGYLTAIWFGRKFLEQRLTRGVKLALSGNISIFRGRIQMDNPEFDILEEKDVFEALNTGRIIPIYSSISRLNSMFFRRTLKLILDNIEEIPEILPLEIVIDNRLLPRDIAFREIHFSSGMGQLQEARRRFSYEELFLLEAGIADLKRKFQLERKGKAIVASGNLMKQFLKLTGFELTPSQKKAVEEIILDMQEEKPMNRLLEGDVGSGKTLVALMASIYTVEGGYQAAFMAPTEVLSEQQYQKFKESLDRLNIRTGIFTGGVRTSEKNKLFEKLKSGEIDIAFGTHALLYENVEFNDLGFIVVDEQHRFGTLQRKALIEKGKSPHVLVMTATPIPRTLALTVFGDLDISIIKDMPDGRMVNDRTASFHLLEKERKKAYEKLRDEIQKGRQGFVVVPLVEESEALEIKTLRNAEEILKKFSGYDIRYAILHGRQRPEEKRETMKKFRENEISVLVSTTVIEVGIDILNASIMIVENAERFGLSQLHQLRGRVGRGKNRGFFFAISNLPTEESKARIRALMECSDGFELAERDLIIRGEGEILGLRQSGMPMLKIARYARDQEMIIKARDDAFSFILGSGDNITSQILLSEGKKRYNLFEMAFIS